MKVGFDDDGDCFLGDCTEPYLLYSRRKKLATMFEEWAEANRVKNCPESVVTWLTGNGLIDCEKAVWFMEGQKDG